MGDKIIYLSYPEKLLSTPEASTVIKVLETEYPGHKVLSPWSLLLTFSLPCRKCMDTFMKEVLYPAIEGCSIFAIWEPFSTCRLKCEIHKAWELGKPLIYISYNPDGLDTEDLTLREYYLIEAEIQ